MTLDIRLAAAIESVGGLCADRSPSVAGRPAMGGEVLIELFSFFEALVHDRPDAELVRREAAAWAQLVATQWSPTHVATARVQQLLDVLIEIDDDSDPEPAGDRDELVHLARAAADARADAGARPRLWRQMHADGVWLAVLDADARDDGIELRLLTVRRDGGLFVVGASTEAHLASLIGDRLDQVRLVHAPGHHLSRIWPPGHHLVLDPGTPHVVVVSPAEMTGLPGGPMIGHPDLSPVDVTDPDPTDWRHGRLEALVGSVEGCAGVVWRCVGADADVLVVAASDAADLAPVMARLAERAPLYGFSGAVAVPADTDLGRRVAEG